MAEFIDGVHIEVKRVERFNLYDALEQAERDSGPLDVPVVMHRKSRKDWVFVVKTRDMLRFMDMYDEARKKAWRKGSRRRIKHHCRCGAVITEKVHKCPVCGCRVRKSD